MDKIFFFFCMLVTFFSVILWYCMKVPISFCFHYWGFFSNLFFNVKDNFFTEFCCFLPNISMNQPQIYVYMSPPSWTSGSSPSPSHTSRLFELPESYSKFLLPMYFTYGGHAWGPGQVPRPLTWGPTTQGRAAGVLLIHVARATRSPTCFLPEK